MDRKIQYIQIDFAMLLKLCNSYGLVKRPRATPASSSDVIVARRKNRDLLRTLTKYFFPDCKLKFRNMSACKIYLQQTPQLELCIKANDRYGYSRRGVNGESVCETVKNNTALLAAFEEVRNYNFTPSPHVYPSIFSYFIDIVVIRNANAPFYTAAKSLIIFYDQYKEFCKKVSDFYDQYQLFLQNRTQSVNVKITTQSTDVKVPRVTEMQKSFNQILIRRGYNNV